ncbi:NUDIX domain-containing protein [Psychrobacter sp. 1U2]|uniref:NUDIX domain-containing protein n=1 Tax=Psychrobacter sp. 1U2 TaxID=3453577 RepID=UPI003F462146
MPHSSHSTFDKSLTEPLKDVVNVAVAVIYYQDQYLLGYRDREQHQGDRYEFVGGKIEANETAVAALIREVEEETGFAIDGNVMIKLGRLHHNYGDKQVCLHVYKIELSAEQYQHYRQQEYGLEAQMLTWVHKHQLLSNHYPLPAANQTILAWLRLPKHIAITYPLAHFEMHSFADEDLSAEPAQKWLEYHQQQLSSQGWSYLRLKLAQLEDNNTDKEIKIITQLLAARSDISAIIPYRLRNTIDSDNFKNNDISANINKPTLNQDNSKISAYHLTQTELMTWFNHYQKLHNSQDGHTKDNTDFSANRVTDKIDCDFSLDLLNPSYQGTTGLIISCHDAESIAAANQLANLRLARSLAPVIAIFLSPILATKTHPEQTPLGWYQWSLMAALADMPVIALGGLSPAMSDLAATNGANTVAGIRSF